MKVSWGHGRVALGKKIRSWLNIQLVLTLGRGSSQLRVTCSTALVADRHMSQKSPSFLQCWPVFQHLTPAVTCHHSGCSIIFQSAVSCIHRNELLRSSSQGVPWIWGRTLNILSTPTSKEANWRWKIPSDELVSWLPRKISPICCT